MSIWSEVIKFRVAVATAVSQVDFQDAEARTVTERRREEERQRRREAMYKERVEAASKEMEGKPPPPTNRDQQSA